MSFAATLDPAPAVLLHLGFVTPAVVLGTVVLFCLSPGRWHRRLGRVWVGCMAGVAVTGFFIPGTISLLGPIGPLHLFSALTLWTLWRGIRAARAGQVAVHRAAFEGLWFGGIGLAGLMNFIPGRTVNRALLGQYWEQGWWVIGIGVVLLGLVWLRRHLPALGRA